MLVKYSRVFYLLRSYCSPQVLRTLYYYGLVNSKLEYGLCIWGGTYGTTLKPLIILQKSFVRHVANSHILEHTEALFKEYKINGAVVLVVDDHANVKGHFSTHFPFHLLKKVGVETIDPFIPINVPEYSPLEFQNYLDYLEEMRWLQKPEGRDEIEFITQRNPRLLNTYCANR